MLVITLKSKGKPLGSRLVQALLIKTKDSDSSIYQQQESVMIRTSTILLIAFSHSILFVPRPAMAQDGGEKERTGTTTGELKSRINAKTGKSVVLEILAAGEERPRRYLVSFNPKDPKAEAPFKEVLAAVNTAKVGDRVKIAWVHGPKGSEGGFFVTAFEVLKKSDPGKEVEKKPK